MGYKLDRLRGQNAKDNLIDSLLSFNTASTWTTSSGTGSASIDANIVYEGSGSLKITNTLPTTDLTVSNSVQSTVIGIDNNYGLALYLRKVVAEDLTLEMKVFQNETLFDTQTFELKDTTNWIPFVSDVNYNFNKADDVTFTFTLKGNAGTTELNTTLWIDGLQLYAKDSLNSFPPQYSKPTQTEATNQAFGTSDFQDTATTSAPIALPTDTYTDLTNNGLGVNTNTSDSLSGVDIYDPLTGLFDFSGLEVGDWVDFRIDLSAILTSSNSVINIELLAGIGGTEFSIPFVSDKYYKTSGTKRIVVYTGIKIGSESTRIRPAKLRMKCDSTATVIVNGWLIKTSKRLV